MAITPAQQLSWSNALKLMEQNVQSAIYMAHLKHLELYAVNGDSIIIKAPNYVTKQAISGRYLTMIDNAIYSAFGKRYNITLALEDELEKLAAQTNGNMLNSRYTFDNYVVGDGNRMAYATAVAVADAPGESYNPLFIYGGVGLGKTHLMNAIGNFIQQNHPGLSVLFISSETFTNEFIDAIVKKKGTSGLREKMRNVDVLMVDDIQFLSKTTATQEEFFHTFNDLHNKGKQIILSSDRPPREIPTIEERLRSRFEWGLTVDIRKPDFETRLAILKRKCEDESIFCTDDVLEYIAGRVSSNIRELEGALNRLQAKSRILGSRMIDLEMAVEELDSILPASTPRAVNAQMIIAAVAERYDVTPEDIMSKKRNKEFTLPRQISMHLIREMTSLSTTAIGRELGGKDHTTIMHGCDRIAQAMRADPTLRKNIDELRENIVNG